jgi:excisionase family DNA binding protein
MEKNSSDVKGEPLQLLSIKEVCQRLGVGHWAVYQQINRRALKTVKIGKRRLVSTRAVEEFINNQEQYGA